MDEPSVLSVGNALRNRVQAHLSETRLPVESNLLMNLADNLGRIDFWRFVSEEEEISAELDAVIMQLLRGTCSLSRDDGILFLKPISNLRVLYLRKLPIGDYPKDLTSEMLKAAIEAYYLSIRPKSNGTVVEKVQLILRKDNEDVVKRFKGTAYVWFVTEQAAAFVRARHQTKPIRWADRPLAIETMEEYISRKVASMAEGTLARRRIEDRESADYGPHVPEEIAQVFWEQRQQQPNRLAIDFGEGPANVDDDDDVIVISSKTPHRPSSQTTEYVKPLSVEESQALIAAQSAHFRGVIWNENSEQVSCPTYEYSTERTPSGVTLYRCKVTLDYQGHTYLGSSGAKPYPKKKGLSGAKLAAECDLVTKAIGRPLIEEVQALNSSRGQSIADTRSSASMKRARSALELLPPAKRAKISASKSPAAPTAEEILRFYWDAILCEKSPPSSQELTSDEQLLHHTEVFCTSLFMGFMTSPTTLGVIWSTSNDVKVVVDTIKDNLTVEFTRHYRRYRLSNLLSCLADAFDVQICPVASTFDIELIFYLRRNPRLFMAEVDDQTGKVGDFRRCGDFTGDLVNIWQDTSVIKISLQRDMRNNIIPMLAIYAGEGIVRVRHDETPLVSNAPVCQDWRTWRPTSSPDIPQTESFQKLPFLCRFKLACLATKRMCPATLLHDAMCTILASADSHCTKCAGTRSSAAFAALQHVENRAAGLVGGEIVDLVVESVANTMLKHECPTPIENSNVIWVCHVVVTPTRLYCEGPYPEEKNRMLREFSSAADRHSFLRVSFRDESGKLSKNLTSDQVRSRLKVLFDSGLNLPLTGRKYDFLMFSASQLRQHKAWFVWRAPGVPTAHYIREWVGQLDHIKSVGKFASRLGLVLSSSTAVFSFPASSVGLVPEIVHDGCTFSDGIGALSPALAVSIARALNLNYVPSCFQIRYAGVKGVVAVHPPLGEREEVLRVRDSMVKFESLHTSLEILAWAKPHLAHLNRQVILQLSNRGIRDEVFLRRQARCIEEGLDAEHRASFTRWRSRNSRPKLGALVDRLLDAGFDPKTEPFLQSVLSNLNAQRLADLRSSAHIPMTPNEARYLIGTLDEYAILNYGQVYIAISSDPNDPNSPVQVVLGNVVVSRSPCLRPGDLRVLKAVNCPELEHMRDCIVFPQLGTRSHPSECSGGDLDGDIYLCIWALDMIPDDENRLFDPAPLDLPSPADHQDDTVSVADISDFFVHYVRNDYMGALADAHMAISDKSLLGINDHKCLQLANAYYTAVDRAKTGARVDAEAIKLASVQLWPDFMQRSPRVSYQSEKILGKLFRQCDTIEMKSQQYRSVGWDQLVVDPDIASVKGWRAFIQDIVPIRDAYHASFGNIIEAFGAGCEMALLVDVASSDSHDDKKGVIDIQDGLHAALDDLEARFTAQFEQLVGTHLRQPTVGQQALRESIAAAWYMSSYSREFAAEEGSGPLLNFAWLCSSTLCDTKKRSTSKRI